MGEGSDGGDEGGEGGGVSSEGGDESGGGSSAAAGAEVLAGCVRDCWAECVDSGSGTVVRS
jgi:hypothetical protein